MPKKILIIPARRHILEAYCEYLIRYLSDEFYFEMGYPPEPPYTTIAERIARGEISPLSKNPDDFDLIYPQFTTHFFLEPPEKYYHKIALVYLEPGSWQKVAVVAGANKPCEDDFGDNPYHSVRFGIDTETFKPYPMVRTDNLLHIGFVGNWLTPRRYVKNLFMPLKDLEGTRLTIFPTVWPNHVRDDEIESVGGRDFLESVVDGDKWYPGLPNIYNQMDIYIRCDINHGEQLSIMEAAACGIPVVCVDSGNSSLLAEAGGAINIDNGNSSWDSANLDRIAKEIRRAVISLRDDENLRYKMSIKARKFILDNWTWDKFIPAWRNFFRDGLKNAMSGMQE